MKNTKASLPMELVVIMAILVIVLIVLMIIFGTSAGWFTGSVLPQCEVSSKAGTSTTGTVATARVCKASCDAYNDEVAVLGDCKKVGVGLTCCQKQTPSTTK